MDTFYSVVDRIKPQVEGFHEQLISSSNRYFKGTQIFFSPYVPRPTFLFIGINPGAGYYNAYGKQVKRFSPMQNFEYVDYNYQLARETRTVLNAVGLGVQLKRSMKINYYFFATSNQHDLYKLLSSLKEYNIYYKSRIWIEELIGAIDPKIIVCEGKSTFDKLVGDASVTIVSDGVYLSRVGNRPIIGYSRNQSFIRNKIGLGALMKRCYLEMEVLGK